MAKQGPSCCEVRRWPETRAFLARLGVPDRPDLGLVIEMIGSRGEPVRITQSYLAQDTKVSEGGACECQPSKSAT